MSRREIFRTNAGECLRLAEAMKSPEVRTMLIAMAHAWHRLAQEFDMQGERSVGSRHLKEDTADPAQPDWSL
jgi:hypothetical protein